MAFKTIYPQEKFGLDDLLKAFFSNVRSDFKIANNQKRFRKNWIDILGFRWNQFWGTYQGYKQSGPLTWKLKQAFYYPRLDMDEEPNQRTIEPIQYQDLSRRDHNNE